MKKGRSSGTEAEASAGQNEGCRAADTGKPESTPVDPKLAQQEITAGETAEELAADPCQEIKQALESKERDFAVLSDKYLRLAAEYDNFRRRSQKEKDALYTDSIVLVIKEILPVVDNLERAGLAAAKFEHEDARKIADGIGMIQKQVDQALAKLGVSVIDSVGQTFDPEFHEAVMHVDDDNAGPSTIVTELQKGYRRDDRVIRHSIVTVAN